MNFFMHFVTSGHVGVLNISIMQNASDILLLFCTAHGLLITWVQAKNT